MEVKEGVLELTDFMEVCVNAKTSMTEAQEGEESATSTGPSIFSTWAVTSSNA